MWKKDINKPTSSMKFITTRHFLPSFATFSLFDTYFIFHIIISKKYFSSFKTDTCPKAISWENEANRIRTKTINKRDYLLKRAHPWESNCTSISYNLTMGTPCKLTSMQQSFSNSRTATVSRAPQKSTHQHWKERSISSQRNFTHHRNSFIVSEITNTYY